MSSAPESNIAGAMLFIRDLYYNPTLRQQYFQALNSSPKVKEINVAKLLAAPPYSCLITDVGTGWDTLAKQSFLAWQSVYQLTSLGKSTGSTDTMDHTVTIIGSRTGDVTVLFDNITVIGVATVVATKNNPTAQPKISWQASNSNGGGNKNVILAFSSDASTTTDPTHPTGERKIDATIWNPTDPTPTGPTHSGHDFFSNMANFEGTYTTITTDPSSGEEDQSYPASVTVNSDNSGGNETINVNIQAAVGSLSVAQSLTAFQNQVSWTAANNSTTTWGKDARAQVWQQGYLTFGWTYTPPKTTTTTPTAANLVQNFNGSIWMSDIAQLVEVEGDIEKATMLTHVHSPFDEIVGSVVSVAIFLVVGVGIAFAIRNLRNWLNSRNLAPTNEIAMAQRDQAAADDNGMLGGPVNVVAPDPHDFNSLPQRTTVIGQPETDAQGNPVRVNIWDPNGPLALSEGHLADGTAVVRAVTSGGANPDTSNVQLLPQPVENPLTQQNMLVRSESGLFMSDEIQAIEGSEAVLNAEGRPYEPAPIDQDYSDISEFDD
ncbi:hypothetical protein GGX14DRAFT_571783 [Mycena pura]|uniref:Uncharacterized protein n=1 Tax=Mycena pura TaxID=153505 RepID=A0AAD6Y9H1_9AGAR|nr:hypothetical protein GGX14DRAFT_571783 [Mycena pura]